MQQGMNRGPPRVPDRVEGDGARSQGCSVHARGLLSGWATYSVPPGASQEPQLETNAMALAELRSIPRWAGSGWRPQGRLVRAIKAYECLRALVLKIIMLFLAVLNLPGRGFSWIILSSLISCLLPQRVWFIAISSPFHMLPFLLCSVVRQQMPGS